MPWCYSNKESEWSVWQDFKSQEKKSKKTSKGGMVSHAHGLTGLIY